MPFRTAILSLATAATLSAQIAPSLFDRLEYRNIGPASMGGRTTDIAGVPGNPALVYVATASGGLFKTTNGGTSWTPIFDHENTISIGAIAVDPHNPDVVWVGTGEANARNSVSFGDGVYKTLDGGKTWRNLGLKDSRHISRIVINPLNTNIAYVAALGHNTGPNEERGVFMTTDGGETWKKSLYIDAEHGAADMDIDAGNPNILYATMWKFQRRPWTFSDGGDDKTGAYRSLDGGHTWSKLENGLAKKWGRLGVKAAPSSPNVVYVIGESNDGTLYRSDDRGDHFRMMTKNPDVVGRGLYYCHMQIDPTDENRLYAIAMSLYTSIDGGKNWKHISQQIHGDHHTVWIDPKNPARIWQGNDGGIAVSYDRAETWEFVDNLALGQFYQIYADNREPFYHVSGGLQDNGTHNGPSRTKFNGIRNGDWEMISFGDGFHVVANADDPDLFLSENQGGGIVRTNLRTKEQQDVSPQPRRNDGGPAGELKYRFNWNAPIVRSPHDKNTVYFGGNVIFKTTDFGKSWMPISPDLTTNDPAKIGSVGTVWTENTTAEYHCTVIRIAESPVQPGLIWAGTDDGNLQLTTDGGKSWTNLTGRVPGVPKFAEIASIEPSRTAANTAYVAFEHHWFDDLHPYLYKTTDGGRTWTNIAGNLPEKNYIWVVREDPKNPQLLYVGTELGLYVSYTGGNQWMRLHLKNLPTVAVRDLLIHPRENDLVLGTHGRSIWVVDDATPIQQMKAEVLAQPAFLFDMRTATRYDGIPQSRYGYGNKGFNASNPPYGAYVTYYLKDGGPVKVEILDSSGKVIRELKEPPKDAGLNRTVWDLRVQGPRPRKEKSDDDDDEGEFGPPPRGPQVLPGQYAVRLIAAGVTIQKPLEVRVDPTVQVSPADLLAQYQYGLKLRDLQSAGNEALRVVDAMKEQVQQTQKGIAVIQPSKDLVNALSERLHQLNSMEDKLIRASHIPGYSMGPRIVNRLSQLAAGIDRSLVAPTPYQREHFEELKGELAAQVTRVNEFLSKGVPELNEALHKNNAGQLIPMKPVEWER